MNLHVYRHIQFFRCLLSKLKILDDYFKSIGGMEVQVHSSEVSPYEFLASKSAPATKHGA